MPKIIQPKNTIPDLVVAEDDFVIAVYVTGQDLLKKESPVVTSHNQGVPFAFYNWRGPNSLALAYPEKYYPNRPDYLSSEKLGPLLRNAIYVDSRLPEHIDGIPLEELVKRIYPSGRERGIINIPHPTHSDDRIIRVRTEEDYQKILNETLPEVRKERAEKEFYSSKLNSALAVLGLKKPLQHPVENPITYKHIRQY